MVPSSASSNRSEDFMGFKKRRRRRNLAAPEPLEFVIDRASEHRFAKKQLPIPLARWRAVVGPRIADRARPIALERGVLIVKVATSVWANELSMLAPEILAKLKTPIDGAPPLVVTSLRFRVGPVDEVEGVKEKRDYRKVPPPAVLAPDLEQALSQVEDDDLRRAIEGAARANLAWYPSRLNEERLAARGPRAAGGESAPPGRSAAGFGEASPRTRATDSDPRR